MRSTRGTTLADEINDALRPLGGYLRCEKCRYELPLGNVGLCVTLGWPVCHGETMRWWTQRQVDAGEVPT